MPKRTSKPAKPRTQTATSAKSAPASAPTEVRGELRQLASLRANFPPLDAHTSAALLAQHDAESCRARGGSTRAADTFRIAMNWGRTLGDNARDPGIQPAQARWFLDCLTSLGTLLTGGTPHASPADTSRLADAEHTAQALITRTERRVRSAAGTNAAWVALVDAALTPDGILDPNLSKLRGLSGLLTGWLSNRDGAPALAVFRITNETVTELRAAAKALDEAIATRPAAKQFEHDSPAVNEAEGRVYFAMRTLWDDVAEARHDGTSTLQFTVTPAVMRGLNLHGRARAATAPTPGAAS